MKRRDLPITVCLPGVILEPRSMRPLGSWAAHPAVSRNDDIRALMEQARHSSQRT